MDLVNKRRYNFLLLAKDAQIVKRNLARRTEHNTGSGPDEIGPFQIAACGQLKEDLCLQAFISLWSRFPVSLLKKCIEEAQKRTRKVVFEYKE